MSRARQLLVLVLLVITPFTIPHHTMSAAADNEPTETSWPAFDDGCPADMIGDVGEGWDYVNGVWIDASGATIGYAPEEDECIRPVTDDLAPAVRTTSPAQPATLPVTL